jgi:hypothetical protein
MLGAGHTHKKGIGPDGAAFAKAVRNGLNQMLRAQDRKTGKLPGGMYAHALGTLALSRAYGKSKDPLLRGPAQFSVNYLVRAQHGAGGWRYAPGQAGDTSVTSWVVQALHAARKAGLTVPDATLNKAARYLDSVVGPDEGYPYLTGSPPTPTMTAAGLTCRQLLQGWKADNPRLRKGIEGHLTKVAPGKVKNLYQSYYVAYAMRAGGEAGKEWNEKMVAHLLKTQDQGNPDQAMAGSWSSVGDAYSGTGGRMMSTSLALLILQGDGKPTK